MEKMPSFISKDDPSWGELFANPEFSAQSWVFSALQDFIKSNIEQVVKETPIILDYAGNLGYDIARRYVNYTSPNIINQMAWAIKTYYSGSSWSHPFSMSAYLASAKIESIDSIIDELEKYEEVNLSFFQQVQKLTEKQAIRIMKLTQKPGILVSDNNQIPLLRNLIQTKESIECFIEYIVPDLTISYSYGGSGNNYKKYPGLLAKSILLIADKYGFEGDYQTGRTLCSSIFSEHERLCLNCGLMFLNPRGRKRHQSCCTVPPEQGFTKKDSVKTIEDRYRIQRLLSGV